MEHRQAAGILNLPDEILQDIFGFVSDDSIFAVTQVCRRFYLLSNLPIAWRERCARFQFWESSHKHAELLKSDSLSTMDWKRLFARRFASDKRVTQLLNNIISSNTNKIMGFESIAEEGYDAKDTLKRELLVDDDAEDVLARRYYASEALSFLHRQRAIEIWKRVSNGDDVPLEEALGAFDLFVTRGANRDVEHMKRSLDELARKFRARYPHDPSLTARETASQLITFMREERFTGAAHENYHILRNSFLGICIDSNRATLPLTTVAVFCALGGRIGLDVKPCGITYHVIAIVSEPKAVDNNEGGPIVDKDAEEGEEEQGKYNLQHSDSNELSFWDPYKSAHEIPRAELEQILHNLGRLPHDTFLTSSTTQELIVRVARNILESVRLAGPPQPTAPCAVADMDRPPFYPERHAALYAALYASVICGPPPSSRLLEHMCTLMQRDFYMDVGFFETDMARLIADDDALMLHNICKAVRAEDAMKKRPVERKDLADPRQVRYHVGTVFRHKRYDYEAVITGWTANCETEENWIRSMDVDKLKRGRHQPFYNVFVSDGSSRYVAEDNIIMLEPSEAGVLSGFLAMGKYFKRFDVVRGRFVSNLKEEYPDD